MLPINRSLKMIKVCTNRHLRSITPNLRTKYAAAKLNVRTEKSSDVGLSSPFQGVADTAAYASIDEYRTLDHLLLPS
jgi:hypothetical protein